MGGLLQPRWKLEAKEQERQIEQLRETIAVLEKEVASLLGRLRSQENSSLAANNRCERLETRLGKLEAQFTMPDTFERRSSLGDEDQEPLVRMKTCPTCRGAGIVAWMASEPIQAIPCTSCKGTGRIEVPL